jgi:uncharacterized protein (DUF1697 family)
MWVVFLRAVNVGGHNKFQPSIFAKQVGAISIGAAGTFVIKEKISQAMLRSEFAKRLPFVADMMVCPVEEILELKFGREPPAKGVKQILSILERDPLEPPRLPIEKPPGDKWEVKVVGQNGRYVFSLWRRLGKRIIYPNEVVEKNFGLPATTRGWSTIAEVCSYLGK